MASSNQRGGYPPGPGFKETLHIASALKNGSVSEFDGLRQQFGDIVWLGFPVNAFVIFHPSSIEHVMQSNHRNYRKSNNYEEMKFVMGNGLVTSEGDLWKRQRRTVGREFTRAGVKRYADSIVRVTAESLSVWQSELDSTRAVDIAEELGKLSCKIAGEVFFGIDTEAVALEVRYAAEVASDAFLKRVYSAVTFPRWVPTPANLRERRAVATLDRIIEGLITHYEEQLDETPNVLWRLLNCRDEETGEPMSRRQIRDEAMTLFLAGHDTICAALTWFLYLVSTHPEIEERIVGELDEVLQARAPSVQDLVKLDQTRCAFQESMRLFPPIPMMARTPIEDDTLGGYPIPAGSVVLCPISSVHCDERFWSEPMEFRPERFSSDSSIEAHSFIPFGCGPRKCIGDDMAMVEGLLVGTAILQRFKLRLAPGFQPIPRTTITMNPADGMMMTLEPR